MWAPQISADQQINRIFISPKICHCWGGDDGCDMVGPGSGTPSPSGLWPLCTRGRIEGLLHGAINISFINVSGFSRQTMHYFMVGKNQRKFKMRVELKLC